MGIDRGPLRFDVDREAWKADRPTDLLETERRDRKVRPSNLRSTTSRPG